MDKQMKMTVDLTIEEVQQACVEYVRANLKDVMIIHPADVKFNLISELEGFGMGEHEVSRLTGVTVKVAKNITYRENT